MSLAKNPGRVAGLLYLLIAVTAPIGQMYVPGKLFVRGDAAATAKNILASQPLFRIGIVSGLASAVVLVFLALALYRLLKSVNAEQGVLMVILALAQVPLAFLNEVNHLAALILVRGADFLSVFDQPQRDALAMLFLRLHGQGVTVSEVFWGLWLFPFGLLVFRSGFLPRFLGVWLIINGFAYLALSLVGLLSPQYSDVLFKVSLPALFGEIAIVLWLLVKGARPQPSVAVASSGVGG